MSVPVSCYDEARRCVLSAMLHFDMVKVDLFSLEKESKIVPGDFRQVEQRIKVISLYLQIASIMKKSCQISS